jgi:methoxymalonate biosynthesis acyl carrier protein
MSDQILYDQIAAFFSESLNLTVSSPSEDLFETGALDSMAFVDLVMHLEQKFDIRISADELEPDNFRSIVKIAGFVAAHNGLKRMGSLSTAISMRAEVKREGCGSRGLR